MKRVNIQAAKTHLSRLVDEVAENGEEIVLAKAGKPLVRLVPYVKTQSPRTPGLFAKEGWEADDCWSTNDDPLNVAAEGALFHGAVEEQQAQD